MGTYNTAGMAGWAVGPILGSQMDPNTWGPFLAGLGGTAVAFAFLLPTRRIDVHLRVGREARTPLARLLAVDERKTLAGHAEVDLGHDVSSCGGASA